MTFVRRTKELNKAIRAALTKGRISHEALAAHLGFDGHSNVTRKLGGYVPWGYEEVVMVSDFVGEPHLVCDLHTGTVSHPIKNRQVRTLAEILELLPQSERDDVLEVAHKILRHKDTPTIKVKLRSVLPAKIRKGHKSG
jgi:hypothetical protein